MSKENFGWSIPLQAGSIDVSELEKLIEKAKQYANEDGQYTKESFQALQEAITEAESALPTIKSEEDLKKAIQSLETAIKGLKLLKRNLTRKIPKQTEIRMLFQSRIKMIQTKIKVKRKNKRKVKNYQTQRPLCIPAWRLVCCYS